MSRSPTMIDIPGASFDIAAVGNWLENHIEVVLVIVLVFWIFQRGGFAEKFLEYRLKCRELDAKQLDDSRMLANMLRMRHGPDEPLLPFDDMNGDQE